MTSFFANLLDFALAPRVLWTVLWIGLAALTGTLVVLMQTRWGQARPLSKCIVLSVFAHMLLVGYAYMTDLFVAPIGLGPESSAVNNVRIIGVQEPQENPDEEKPTEKQLQPWEKYDTEATITPEELALRRELIDLDQQPQQRESTPASLGNAIPTPLNLQDDLTLAGDQTILRQKIHDVSTGAQAAKVEAPKPQRRDDAVPRGPEPDTLVRSETPVTNVRRPAASDRQLPNDLLAAPPQLQRFDIDRNAEVAGALPAEQDLTQATLQRAMPKVAGTGQTSTAPNQPIPSDPPRPPAGNTDTAVAAANAGARGPADEGIADDARQRAVVVGEVRVGNPKRLRNGRMLPEVYQLRVQERAEIVEQLGGNARTEAAVQAALRWLAANQMEDGRWDASAHGAGRETRVFGHDRDGAGAESDTGITALAVLAMMGAGHDHLEEGPYRANVQRGLEFLLRSQARDGNMAGEAKTFAAMYCHGIATLAICEAYAITGDERMKWWVHRAVRYTISAQNSTDGGWRYQPGDKGDLSQFGWQVMGLRSAELAGVDIPRRTTEGMHQFLVDVSSGRHDGLASYRPREPVTASMTAEALACRFFLGTQRDDPAAMEAAAYLLERRPGRERANLYYWYYGTLAMFQLQDARWDKWNEALQARLVPTQRKDGRLAGSWDPEDTVWGSYGGRVYTTAMAALCLESYYRFTPLRSN